MPYTLEVSNDYGYVLMIALGAIPVLSFVQGVVVGQYRGPAKVKLPNAYASAEQAEKSRAAYEFNCAQRAHVNLLENMPQTMMYMLVGGLAYPRVTALLGAGWTISRILFAYGYVSSKKPNGSGRYLGGAFWLAQAGLWGTALATAVKFIF